MKKYAPNELSADNIFDPRTKIMIKKINKAAAATAAKMAESVSSRCKTESLTVDVKATADVDSALL